MIVCTVYRWGIVLVALLGMALLFLCFLVVVVKVVGFGLLLLLRLLLLFLVAIDVNVKVIIFARHDVRDSITLCNTECNQRRSCQINTHTRVEIP